MSVTEQLYAKLERTKDDATKAFIKKCLETTEEESLVNDDIYISRKNQKITYGNRSIASLSRLIEFKHISNEELAAVLQYGKNRICNIRQGKVIPRKAELAEICIALELNEFTISKLFDAFEYTYCINDNLIDRSLHYVIHSSDRSSVESRLKLFRAIEL